MVGPNLTDDYYKNVKRYRHRRGHHERRGGGSMPSWKTRLHPNEVVLMAAYVAGLRGKNLKGRAHEGDKIDPWPTAASRMTRAQMASAPSTAQRQAVRIVPLPTPPEGGPLDAEWKTARAAGCARGLSPGRFLRARRILACADRRLSRSCPTWKIHGKPAVLLDLPRREFTIFGFTFLSTDTLSLALALITSVLGDLPGDGPGRPRVVRLDVSADGLHGVRLPAHRAAFRRARRRGASIAGAKSDDAAHVGKYAVYLVVSVYLAQPSWPTSSASRALAHMGPPFAAGASRGLSRDARA